MFLALPRIKKFRKKHQKITRKLNSEPQSTIAPPGSRGLHLPKVQKYVGTHLLFRGCILLIQGKEGDRPQRQQRRESPLSRFLFPLCAIMQLRNWILGTETYYGPGGPLFSSPLQGGLFSSTAVPHQPSKRTFWDYGKKAASRPLACHSHCFDISWLIQGTNSRTYQVRPRKYFRLDLDKILVFC